MTGFHVFVEAELRTLLEIPDEVFMAATITIGKPVGGHGPVRRRPISELVYEETWDHSPDWAVDPPGRRHTAAGPPKSPTDTETRSRSHGSHQPREGRHARARARRRVPARGVRDTRKAGRSARRRAEQRPGPLAPLGPGGEISMDEVMGAARPAARAVGFITGDSTSRQFQIFKSSGERRVLGDLHRHAQHRGRAREVPGARHTGHADHRRRLERARQHPELLLRGGRAHVRSDPRRTEGQAS